MIDVLKYIKNKFPEEWLSNLGEDINNAGVDISHPSNSEEYLSISIFPNIVGVGILLEKDRDILLDLSGFDYSFKREDVEKLKYFLDHFYETGVTSWSSL